MPRLSVGPIIRSSPPKNSPTPVDPIPLSRSSTTPHHTTPYTLLPYTTQLPESSRPSLNKLSLSPPATLHTCHSNPVPADESPRLCSNPAFSRHPPRGIPEVCELLLSFRLPQKQPWIPTSRLYLAAHRCRRIVASSLQKIHLRMWLDLIHVARPIKAASTASLSSSTPSLLANH